MFPYLHAITVTFILGIWAANSGCFKLSDSLNNFAIWWWIGGEFLLLFVLFINLKGNLNFIFLLIASFAIGEARLNVVFLHASNDVLIPFRERHLTVTGKIYSPIVKNAAYETFFLKTYNVGFSKKSYAVKTNILVKCKIPCGFAEDGDTLQVQGILIAPKEIRNPGDFSQRTHLLKNHTYNILLVKGVPKKVPSVSYGVDYFIANTRKKVKHLIETIAPYPIDNIISGIAFGQRENLPKEAKDAFLSTGTSHLLVASGSNIGIVIAISFIPFFVLKTRRLKIFCAVFAATMAVVYALIVGIEPSIWRATIMGIIGLIAFIYNKEKGLPELISLSALILLFYQPFFLFDAGFQFSFLTVLGILLFMPRISPWFAILPKWLAPLITVTLAAQLAVAPLEAYYFQRLPLIAPLANLIAVPLAIIVLVLAFICFLFLFVFWYAVIGISFWLNLSCWSLWHWISFCATLPGAAFQIPKPSIWVIAACYLALLFWSLWPHLSSHSLLKWKFRLALVILIFIGFYPTSKLRVIFLDVGQGDSAVIFFQGKKVAIIDGGKIGINSSPLLKILKNEGIRKIDYLILTHPHIDHLEGLLAVMDEYPVRQVFYSKLDIQPRLFKVLLNKAKLKNVHIEPLWADKKLIINDEVYLVSFWPTFSNKKREELPHSNFNNYKNKAFNNSSLVLKLYHKKVSFLFTGDVEKEAQLEILAKSKKNLAATILKTPHHGSSNAYLPSFIAAVRPKVSIISVGMHNPYSHPAPDAVSGIYKLSNQLYRTDKNGAIIIESNGEQVTCKPMIGESF